MTAPGLAMVSSEAIFAGANAASFVTQPEIWPAYVAWVEEISGIDLSDQRGAVAEYAKFLGRMAEAACEL